MAKYTVILEIEVSCPEIERVHSVIASKISNALDDISFLSGQNEILHSTEIKAHL